MYAPNTCFLIVDDFASMRKMIKKVLIDLGFKNIVEATDGREALRIINEKKNKNEPIDFIISDWNMPHMLGIDLLKYCKNDPELKTLPFVLVTAESEQKNILEAIHAGAAEFVIKPFNANTLKEKLENVFKKAS